MEIENLYYLTGLLIVLWLLSSREHENIYFKTFVRKSWIILESLLFMIYSSDSKGIGPKYNSDPEKMKKFRSNEISTKTIVLIRHGESDWNNVFNKGINLSIFRRFASAFVAELKLTFFMDSIFLDSPLNEEGSQQALELRSFIQSYDLTKNPKDAVSDIVALVRGDKGTSVIASSTLRRAISTTVLSLWPRIEKTQEKVSLLSNLQEISRNIDTRSLSGVGQVADLPFHRIEKYCQDENLKVQDILDVSENFGNKQRNFYGIKRLRSFADWAFKREESAIIVGGHSLWFKYFFTTFLPKDSTHIAKTQKIVNSGVVAFTLKQAIDTDGTALYAIDPESIVVVYGGFEGTKK